MLRFITPAVLVAAVACGPSVQALYPHPEVPRRPDEIATLTGPIASIDETPVSSRGKVFHVLPGWHVVRVMEYLGEMNLEATGGWTIHLPPIVFAIQAEPGHAYSIGLDARAGTGHFGPLSVWMVDLAPSGTATRVSPTKDASAVRFCSHPSRTELLAPE